MKWYFWILLEKKISFFIRITLKTFKFFNLFRIKTLRFILFIIVKLRTMYHIFL